MAPLFSIVTPVYAPPPNIFEKCIESVLRQTCQDWEWCLADDASPDDVTRDRLTRLAAEDSRIKIMFREENGGIVAATNDALALAAGTFIALLDNDDELERNALAVMAEVAATEPELDYAYSDEVVWSVESKRYIRLFKPGWSPERLRSQNYANHFSIYRRSLVEQVGRYREGFDGAQDHDLVLRIGEAARVIRHVPQVLYRWKMAPGSTVGNAEAKQYAFESGVRAVESHCQRVGIDATVEHGPERGIYRVRRRVQGEPLVSIIIPTNAPIGKVRGEERSFLESTVHDVLQRTDYQHVEIIVIPDPQTSREVLERTRQLDASRVRITDVVPRPFSFSRKSNLGAALARGEHLLFLNDDIAVIDPDWLTVLLAISQDHGVGAVGPKLLFENGAIQHAGVFAWHGPGHVGLGVHQENAGHMGLYEVDREVLGVTGACLMSPAEAFASVGGFTLSLPSNWQDVDYCLKLRAAGRRNVWTPQATLTHFESVTRENFITHSDRVTLWGRWYRELVNDPYHTPAIHPVGLSWPMEPSR